MRQCRAKGPGVSAGYTEVGVVLKSIRLIEDVGVGVAVRLGQLEIGLGPPQAVLVGGQVRPLGDGPLDQFFLGNGKFLELADGVEYVDLVDVVQRQVQDQREGAIRRDLGLPRFPDLELGLVHVGLDRVQVGLLDLAVAVKLFDVTVNSRLFPTR